MDDQIITSDLMVEDIFNYWPKTISVFLRHRMGCVGCSMASFEPLSSALEIYGLEPESFISELNDVAVN
jgi:hybrid cluster-associated redox disulfide protein